MTEPESVVVPIGEPLDPPSANAPLLATLICTGPRCPNRGQQVAVHADTVLPVHCGGCYGVLHCDHDAGEPRKSGGNLEDPVEHTVVHCLHCRGELSHDKRELTPQELIENAPKGIAAVLRHLAAR